MEKIDIGSDHNSCQSTQEIISFSVEQLQQKYKVAIETILKQESKKFNEVFETSQQRNFIIAYFGIGDENNYAEIGQVLKSYGKFELTLYPQCSYGYVSFQEEDSVQKIYKDFSNIKGIDNSNYLFRNIVQQNGKKIQMPCFFLATKMKKENFAQSKKFDVPDASTSYDIPGLTVIRKAFKESEIQTLIDCLTQRKWITQGKKKLQIYGFEYDFEKHFINSEQQEEQIPQEIVQVIKKIQNENKILQEFNQVTVQECFPGDGYLPYIDDHHSIEEVICQINLNSDYCLTMKSHLNQEKHLFIEENSLIILRDQARYTWQQSKPNRKYDKVEGKIRFRKKMFQINIRNLSKQNCKCSFPFICIDQGYNPKTMKGYNPMLPLEVQADTSKIVQKKTQQEVQILENNKSESKPTIVEQKYVYDIYDKIAEHFSNTRYKPWPKIVEFLSQVPKGSIIMDVGCGNGKYLQCNVENDYYIVGTDRSKNLLEICQQKDEKSSLFVADSLKLPVRNSSVDYVISIAVIHHFSTPEMRIHAINELIRILRVNGEALIYVWAMEQDEKIFTEQDVFVPWNLQYKFEDESVYKKGKDEHQQLQSKDEKEEKEKEIEKEKEKEKEEEEQKQSQEVITLKKQDGQVINDKYYKINEEKKTVVYKRYYHVFVKGEIEALVGQIKNVSIIDSYYDHANWVVRIKKNA